MFEGHLYLPELHVEDATGRVLANEQDASDLGAGYSRSHASVLRSPALRALDRAPPGQPRPPPL